MLRKAGLATMAVGVVLALLGSALMIVLGPDSRVLSGPHKVKNNAIAIVTAPQVISWAGVHVDVLAELPANKPVFVGLANSVDVQNFVAKTERIVVQSYHAPWDLASVKVAGQPNLPAAPTAMDWWIASSAGLGGAAINTTLPDEAVSLAILAVGASDLFGLEVTLSYGIRGGFGIGAGLVLIGLGLVLSGFLFRRDAPLWAEQESWARRRMWGGRLENESVTYVYVDDDGTEHEVAEDELDEFDVIDPSEETPHKEPI